MFKFPIKSIKTLEEFNSYISFIENEVKVFNEMKSLITGRITVDRRYIRDVVKESTSKRRNLLDGFIIEKV